MSLAKQFKKDADLFINAADDLFQIEKTLNDNDTDGINGKTIMRSSVMFKSRQEAEEFRTDNKNDKLAIKMTNLYNLLSQVFGK